MQLDVAYELLPKQRTVRSSQVLDHFGIDFECGRHVIADRLDLPIRAPDIVLFTGPSGSGKSSLLRAAAAVLANQDAVIDVDAIDLGHDVIIDSLPADFESALEILALCGLSEAQVLLRTPQELSEGQRRRLQLAQALSGEPDWLLADEFTATLNRTLAKVVAFNMRRVADRTGTGFLLATTHTDIIEDLNPDLHVQCDLSGAVRIDRRDNGPSQKKSMSHSRPSCGSAPPPDPTGRTSLGGIIDPIASDRSAAEHCSGTAANRSAFACSRPPPCLSGLAIGSSGSPEHGQPPVSRP